MRIALESPDQPDVASLIAALDAWLGGLYPPASNHLLDVGALRAPEVIFAVARDMAGAACGCGAVVPMDNGGELKRMYVSPDCRGKGVGRALLQFLEQQARQRGCVMLRLETGVHQSEALGLFGRSGYTARGPFGGYHPDPLSVFLEKQL